MEKCNQVSYQKLLTYLTEIAYMTALKYATEEKWGCIFARTYMNLFKKVKKLIAPIEMLRTGYYLIHNVKDF